MRDSDTRKKQSTLVTTFACRTWLCNGSWSQVRRWSDSHGSMELFVGMTLTLLVYTKGHRAQHFRRKNKTDHVMYRRERLWRVVKCAKILWQGRHYFTLQWDVVHDSVKEAPYARVRVTYRPWLMLSSRKVGVLCTNRRRHFWNVLWPSFDAHIHYKFFSATFLCPNVICAFTWIVQSIICHFVPKCEQIHFELTV